MYSLACGLLKHFALMAAGFVARFLFEVQHQWVNRLVWLVDSIKTAGTGNKQGTISKSIWVNYITSQICQSVGSQTLDRSKNLEKTCELERCWNCWNCPGHILLVTIPRPTKDMKVFNSFSRKWWQVICISASRFCQKNQAKRLTWTIFLFFLGFHVQLCLNWCGFASTKEGFQQQWTVTSPRLSGFTGLT